MRLKNLVLENYCQHEGRHEFEFTGNTIGIVGRNGTGKTNLVRAVKDLLTGKFSKSREKTITKGSEKGFIEGSIESYQGRNLRIHRDLHKNSAWVQDLDVKEGEDSEIASTISSTNEVMRSHIPVDPTVLEHVIFAPQEDILKLLFDKNAAPKERLAQAFFGVEKAREIEKQLGSMISDLPGFDDSINDRINETELTIQRAENERHELSVRAGELHVLSEEDEAELRGKLLSYQQSQRVQVERQTIQRDLERIDLDIKALEERLVEERSSIEGFSVETIQARVDEARLAAERNNAIERKEAELQSWIATSKESAERESRQEEHVQLMSKLVTLDNEIGRLQAAIALENDVLTQLQDSVTATCSACEGEVPKDRESRFESRIIEDRDDLNKAIEERRQLESEAQQVSNSISSLQGNAAVAESKIKECEAELKRLGGVKQVEQIQPLLDAIGYINDGVNTIDKIERDIEILSARKLPVQEQLNRLSTEDGAEPPSEEEYRSIQVQVENSTADQRELQSINLRLSSLQGSIETNQRVLGSLNEQHARQSRLRRQREFLTGVRRFFHYSGAPQMVVNSRLLSIQGRINYYLNLLNTSYSVRVGEGLSFVCIFPEKEMDASELSGGEKVDLSVAFRLAACESFCSNVGFIVLDEPTIWLDEETKQEMARVLERLHELGQTNGFQFVIVTHERSLLEYFDQVIQL